MHTLSLYLKRNIADLKLQLNRLDLMSMVSLFQTQLVMLTLHHKNSTLIRVKNSVLFSMMV
jgi:hypothetical protein